MTFGPSPTETACSRKSFKFFSRSIRASNRQFPNTVPRVLNENQRARFQLSGTIRDDFRQPAIHRLWSLIGQAKNDHARFVQDAEREHIAEVEIEREHNARIGAGACHDVEVWCAS